MKYALVTGGSRGIGRAVSIQLAAEAYHVLINYRSNQAEAESTLKEIVDKGGSAELLKFDVSNNEEVVGVLGGWVSSNPDKHIEVLVNNAGITRDNLMVFMPVEDWDSVLATNLNSFFYVSKVLLQPMLLKRKGSIINMVSLSGQKGQPGQVNYAASKGAIIAATKTLAMEIGKKGVRVNAVAPGFIKTEMTGHFDENEMKRLVPLNRFGTAEEVAEVVCFLASSKSSYITGEVISVNGGIYS
ncbi:MAG TPA: 3-oxoacyl-ACP reductase FabG [Marinilabiliaceae bacterium]|nr:3-oxoacyl-ACP reductase FabG [Marinilabiliaceae bacterium]